MDQVNESMLANLYEILLFRDCDLEAICSRLNLACSFDEHDGRDRMAQILLREVKDTNQVRELLELIPELAPDLPYRRSLVADLEEVVAGLPEKMATELSYGDFDELYVTYPRGLPYAPQYRQKRELAEDLFAHARANHRVLSLLEAIRTTRPDFRPVENWDDYWREVIPIEDRQEVRTADQDAVAEDESTRLERQSKIWRPEQVSALGIYRQTFTVFLKRPVQVMLVNLPMIALSIAYTWLFTADYGLSALAELSSNTFLGIVFLLVSLMLLLYVFTLGLLASNIATMIASSDWVLGRRTSLWGVYRRVLTPYLIRGHFDLVKYGLVVMVGVAVVSLILGLMSPVLAALFQIGLVLWLFFAFLLRRFMFAIIIAVEKTKFVRAYERSKYLVSGFYGKVFATMGVTMLCAQIVTAVFGIDFDVGFFGNVSISIDWLIMLIISIVTMPLLQLMTAVIYYELRQVKEGYNEELLALDLGYAPIPEHINL